MSAEERDALRAAAFVAWVDYGMEGWKPTVFTGSREAVEWIEDGGSHGQRFVITRGPLDLTMGAASKEGER